MCGIANGSADERMEYCALRVLHLSAWGGVCYAGRGSRRCCFLHVLCHALLPRCWPRVVFCVIPRPSGRFIAGVWLCGPISHSAPVPLLNLCIGAVIESAVLGSGPRTRASPQTIYGGRARSTAQHDTALCAAHTCRTTRPCSAKGSNQSHAVQARVLQFLILASAVFAAVRLLTLWCSCLDL